MVKNRGYYFFFTKKQREGHETEVKSSEDTIRLRINEVFFKRLPWILSHYNGEVINIDKAVNFKSLYEIIDKHNKGL
jgi:hypothetical protein